MCVHNGNGDGMVIVIIRYSTIWYKKLIKAGKLENFIRGRYYYLIDLAFNILYMDRDNSKVLLVYHPKKWVTKGRKTR